MIKCRKCGYENEDGAFRCYDCEQQLEYFCSECGSKTTEMICPVCNARVITEDDDPVLDGPEYTGESQPLSEDELKKLNLYFTLLSKLHQHVVELGRIREFVTSRKLDAEKSLHR